MVKPEKFDHHHLVYHFTIPLDSGTLKSAFKLFFKQNPQKLDPRLAVLKTFMIFRVYCS